MFLRAAILKGRAPAGASPQSICRSRAAMNCNSNRYCESGRVIACVHIPSNVLQAVIWPLFIPVMNQRTRCSELPCVKLSGTICPCVRR